MLPASSSCIAAESTRPIRGGDCELQVWPDQAHVFQALPRLTPEAAQAMRYVAAFISGALIDSGSGAAGIEQTG